MNEAGFDFDEHDFSDLCCLADIFPDIEPYLDDVTHFYETAKANIDKKKSDGHIDGSDSDSGISADSGTGILKNPDSSSSNGVVFKDKILKSIKINPNFSPDTSHNTNFPIENRVLIKRPISFISKKEPELKQPIYNIIPKVSDGNYQKPKPIFLKSNSLSVTGNDNFKKDLTKPVTKITPIKLLKSNEGYPISINDINGKSSEKHSIYNVQNINLKQIKKKELSVEPLNTKNETNSCYNLFSSSVPKKENVFLQPDSQNTHSDMIPTNHNSDIFETKDDSFVDMSLIDDIQAQDCKSYFDIFNTPQGNKVLQSSSVYNNCDGILDANHYDRMVKKQERMIKNRQAASLSRQRKKEYVERLEHKVEQLKQENHYVQNQISDFRERFCALEQENQLLKRDIQTWRERYYDLERQKIKQGYITNNKISAKNNNDFNNKSKALKATAASTTILGIFIILTFNFNPLNYTLSSFYKSSNEKNIPIYRNNFPIISNSLLDSESRLSRTLLSIIDNSTVVDTETIGSQICNNTTGLNISETLRLTRELNRWGSRFKAESVKVYDRLQNEKIKSQILSKEIHSMYKKSKLRDIPITISKMKRKRDFKAGQLEVYPRHNHYGFFDSFINDIDRNSDTLYFVTFHSDNLIIPASNFNKNLSSPKITLFLPADISQESENYYKMMKIDCQVQNFTIVNLKKVKSP